MIYFDVGKEPLYGNRFDLKMKRNEGKDEDFEILNEIIKVAEALWIFAARNFS